MRLGGVGWGWVGLNGKWFFVNWGSLEIEIFWLGRGE